MPSFGTPGFFRTHRAHLLFLGRYTLAALIGSALNILFLYVWVSLLGLADSYLLGLTLGFILALFVTFALQKLWSFRDRERSTAPRQLVSYTAVAVSGLVLNALLLAAAKAAFEWASVDFFGGWYLVAQTVCIGIVAFFNLAMNFLFTFRRARREQLWNR
jgi:putative flippase GtrA